MAATTSHDGSEAGVVIEGTLEPWVQQQYLRLETGDGFAFDGAHKRRCRNPGKSPTRVVRVITPPRS